MKYNEIQQKNSHNSYERWEELLDQMIYHQIRSIEIDCHQGLNSGEFRVYHDAGYFQSFSSINTLLEGVQILSEFNQRFPNHHIVSIFVDFKDGFSDTHTPQDFDGTIGLLPLWTPADARPNNETSIQEGIEANGWPEIDDMRGKFLWVITSGQETYCADDETCNARLAFHGTSAKAEADIGAKSYAVFYNQNSDYSDMGILILERGYISRVYDLNDIGDAEKWDKAVADKFHHIATDQVNFHEDSFSQTQNANGFPFLALNGLDVSDFDGDEGASVMYMYANSQDTWGLQDGALWVYTDESASVDEWIEYTFTVSLVGSHCDTFAKAGIMFREGPTEAEFPLGSARYFGVMRTCKDFVLARAQYREQPYVFSIAKRLETKLQFQTIEMSFKARYRFDGNKTEAEGYVKRKGTEDEYALIDRQEFVGVQLKFHGLFASSHGWEAQADGTEMKALFADVRRNNETVVASDFPLSFGGIDEFNFGDGYYSSADTSVSSAARRRRVQTTNNNLRGKK